MSDHVTPAAPLQAVVEVLLAGGVRDAVICPGSRSTPMALALRAAPGLRTWVHLDERAGAFFALGAARATRRPVALLATSGTAVVEFAPAVVEARYGRVPLIALTADRPPELQGIGAPQTIDQRELYGRAAKWFAELPVPDDSAESEVETRSLVARALAVAMAPPAGPVQLDLPYREPLVPSGSFDFPAPPEARATADSTGEVVAGPEADGDAPSAADVQAASDARAVPAEAIATVQQAARASARPLIVCGPIDAPGLAGAVGRLAASIGAPIVADALANLRTAGTAGGQVVAAHEAVLRTAPLGEAGAPDLIIRFGATPTSKVLATLLEAAPARQLLVDDGGGWNRPRGGTISRLEADPVALADAAAEAIGTGSSADPRWRDRWLAAGAAAEAALEGWFASLSEPFEGVVPRALAAGLPGDTVVVVGNSMPVRDLDAFLPSTAPLRILGNRGANGIDGLLSTTLGAAATQPRPVVGVLGDLAFLHDVTAVAAATRLGLSATFVLVDNDGGGIFSFLPQARAERPEVGLPEHYETLFGTPHGLDLGALARALGARHVAVDGETLVTELRAATGRAGLDVLHLQTDRERNVTLHRAAFAAATAAVEGLT